VLLLISSFQVVFQELSNYAVLYSVTSQRHDILQGLQCVRADQWNFYLRNRIYRGDLSNFRGMSNCHSTRSQICLMRWSVPSIRSKHPELAVCTYRFSVYRVRVPSAPFFVRSTRKENLLAAGTDSPSRLHAASKIASPSNKLEHRASNVVNNKLNIQCCSKYSSHLQ
jgi:hypothetical protein